MRVPKKNNRQFLAPLKFFENNIKLILKHPINRNHEFSALGRVLGWQFKSRLTRGFIAVPFCNQMRLWVKTGMTGATGNIYCGLHEFESMSFLLHLLTPQDLLIDVGANIGSYSVLAASVGARAIAFEPVPATYQHLVMNIENNKISDLVVAHQIAMGKSKGSARMSTHLDTMNHILDPNDMFSSEVKVLIDTLDDYIQGCHQVRLLKIDAEGHDEDVIEGADKSLAKGFIDAVLIETVSFRVRQKMKSYGFSGYIYDPFSRLLKSGEERLGNNFLFVNQKKIDNIQKHLKTSVPFSVLGQTI